MIQHVKMIVYGIVSGLCKNNKFDKFELNGLKECRHFFIDKMNCTFFVIQNATNVFLIKT